MKRNVRWLMPVTAAVGLLVGMSAISARAADEKPAAKGSISGTVVDKDGKGVADVEVRVMKPMMGRGGRGGPGGPGGPGAGGEGRKPADQATAGEHARPLQAEGEKPKGGGGAGGEGNRPPRPEPVATATTDKDGKFEVKDVPVGEYMVGVRDQDKKVFGMSRVSVKAGETASVEIKTSDTPPQRRGGPGGQGGGQGGAGGEGGAHRGGGDKK